MVFPSDYNTNSLLHEEIHYKKNTICNKFVSYFHPVKNSQCTFNGDLLGMVLNDLP